MDEVPFLSNLDSTGKLVAILRLKKEAASKRMKFYHLRHRQNNAIIAKGDKFESDNRATYEFMHIEHIFTMIQSIESFHGALASAHKMTSSEEKNVDDVLSSLIEPKGIDKIRSKLREEEMATHDLCQILAIPSPNDFPEPNSRIERLLGPTLKLVETMATYSQKYWDMFKAVRNVFAHNYRFVFLDRLPNSQNAFDVLAYWYTSDNGPYDIWLEVKLPSQPLTIMSQKYRIYFDNQKPEADISIDSGPCDLITQGTKITGRFVARDDHIGHFTLQTTPYPPRPKTDPGGLSTGTYMTSTAPGDKWILETVGMKPCGYVVTIRVWDRSIVGSRPSSHNHSSDDEGFCFLMQP